MSLKVSRRLACRQHSDGKMRPKRYDTITVLLMMNLSSFSNAGGNLVLRDHHANYLACRVWLPQETFAQAVGQYVLLPVARKPGDDFSKILGAHSKKKARRLWYSQSKYPRLCVSCLNTMRNQFNHQERS